MTYKVHLDGYNLLPAFKGEAEWPRHEFLYWTDDGNVAALRYNNWKITFMRQNAHGMHVWSQPYEQLRMPMIGNLRSDPFERAFMKHRLRPMAIRAHVHVRARRAIMSANGCRASATFRRARSPAASASTA